MGRLFDISELEANIFSEDELREIDTIAHETNASEEMAMEHEFHEKDAMEWFSENDFTGDETDDFPALELELTLEDGQSLMCEVACVFLVGEREYMALHPKDDVDGLIHIMILEQGENAGYCRCVE